MKKRMNGSARPGAGVSPQGAPVVCLAACAVHALVRHGYQLTCHRWPYWPLAFSPACAAFDQFKNFAVRGNTYKQLVNAL